MKYTKAQFGFELKKKIMKKCSVDEIAKWAFKIYSDSELNCENGLDDILMKLVCMEEGPEFLLNEAELNDLADELMRQKKVKYTLNYYDVNLMLRIFNKINLFKEDKIGVLAFSNDLDLIVNNIQSINSSWKDEFINKLHLLNLYESAGQDKKFVFGEDESKNIDIVNELNILAQEALDSYLEYPDINVKDSAKIEYPNYLNCPNCHHAWESIVKTAMIICPICESVLHNPLSLVE